MTTYEPVDALADVQAGEVTTSDWTLPLVVFGVVGMIAVAVMVTGQVK